MWPSLLSRLVMRHRARSVPTRHKRRAHLQVEALEARWVPSYSMTSLADFGGGPQGGLIADSGGNLFGASGGANGHGQLFEWVKATGTVSVLATFNGSDGLDPNGGLVLDASGNLFGTTGDGGPNGAGTLFEWVKSTGALTVLASFNGGNGSGPNGGLVADTSGNLFGTTITGGANNDGTVFEWVKSSGSLAVVASFNGSNGQYPNGNLIEDSSGSGNLFGTTQRGPNNGPGTVFEWVKSSGSLSVLASFNGSNGSIPNGGLVEDGSGNLFGTTLYGGANYYGTVFEWVKSSGSLSVLTSFNYVNGGAYDPTGGLVADASGNLFGTTHYGGANGYGTVFEWVKSSGSLSTLTSFNSSNGANPNGGLLKDASGNLFGTTYSPYAVSGNVGTVYEWGKSSGSLATLASLGGSNGAYHYDGLVADTSGNLFGTTTNGGAYAAGTIFEWVKSTGALAVLASFTGANGSGPNGSLIEDSSGNLFGTTYSGGAYGGGEIFEWVKSSGSITVLASFNASTAQYPNGGLYADTGGNLFGTTQGGGANNDGTVFEWVKSTGSLSVLAAFNGSNGQYPNGGLVEDASGNLFGTTSGGGAYSRGTLFEWVKGSGIISDLVAFNWSNGAYPSGGLIKDANDNVFGTTTNGGANGYGSVFEWIKSSGSFSTLATFSFYSTGHSPSGTLVEDANGNLFGTTQDGPGYAYGTAFEWVKSSGSLATLASFNGNNGSYPNSGLVADSSGNLFGTTYYGGADNTGALFELAKSTTWTGLSPLNQNWSNPGNWSDGVPTAGETAIFSAHPGGSSTAVVDVPASVVLSIYNDWGGTIQVNQPLTTTTGSHWDSGTISVAGGVSWTNSGTFTLNGGAGLALSGTGALSNAGTLVVSSGTTFTDNGEYTETGTLQVQPGATANLSGSFDNYDGAGTLTGGTYDIQGTFQFTGAAITTNAATIVLDGAFSRIINQSNGNGLANFATNASGAGFTIQNGRNFTAAGDFENDGTLTVGPSSLLNIVGNDTDTGTLNVLSGGTLSLLGGGTASGTVSVAGTLVVTANQTFTDSGSYSETGTLRVLDSATATLSGTFSNFATGTLTGGSYLITGTLQFANAAVVSDAANLVLTGAAASVTDLSGTDALGPNLTTIAAAGQLTVQNGASFTSAADFTDSGTLNVGTSSSAFTSGGKLTVSRGATLTVQNSGTVTTTGDFNVQNNVAIPNGAAISVGGNLNVSSGIALQVQSGGTLRVSGNVSNSGALSIGAVTVSVGGSFTEAHGASLFITTTGGIATGGDFNVQANLGIADSVTLSIGGNLNVAAGTTLTVLTGGTVSPSGDFNNQGTVSIANGVTLTVGGNYTEARGSTLTIANTGGVSTTGDFNVQGTVTVPNGVTITVGGNLNVASATTLTIQTGGSVAPAGNVANQGTLSIASGVTVSVGGNYTEASGSRLSIANTGGLSTSGDFNDQGRVAIGNGASISVGGNLNVTGGTSWYAAGNMSTARTADAATLLANGKVLVTGGYNGSTYLASAELYDPATNTWSAAGSMSTARIYQTATLLANGKVLVAGGVNTAGARLASAELYDPATNTWSAAAPMSTARDSHTATLLANGKVLVTGGYNGSTFVSSAELYDPATNTWSAAGNMSTVRTAHTATLLANGKVLVAGGRNASFGALASADLYDPATNTWSAAGSMSTARTADAATLLANGKVLITGGYNGSTYLSSAELYDPGTNTWSAAGNLNAARGQHTATLLAGGKVLVTGGYNNGYLASAELYDPGTNSWTVTASLSTPRAEHTATLLTNGNVLITAGYNGSTYLASAELYDQGSVTIGNGATVSVGGNLNVAGGATATIQSGGNLGITGDFNNNGSAVVAVGDTVNVGGNYTQASAASLDLQLGGTAAGQFAVLAVTGQANLNGTLKATLVNGYMPQSGDTLPVLTYATRSGTFATGPAGFTLNYDDADGILDVLKS